MSEESDQSQPEPIHPARSLSKGEMDERSRSDRRKVERREKDLPVDPDRRSGENRRSGKPRRKRAMNQYDMGDDVLEFVNAINAFKARAGKAFPTWSEVLEILKSLGYEKQ